MERKFNVKLVRVYKYCPKCPGKMVPITWGSITACGTSGNYTFCTSPYNHQCELCGHGENYDKTYPILEYVDDGEIN
jgi:hypothetical protein